MAVETKDGAGLERARYLGRSIERREDNRLLTGRQRYMDDVVVPGMLLTVLGFQSVLFSFFISMLGMQRR